ncbi:MAG: radical SAM protein [Acidimicrobiales bacterium]
MGRIPPLNQRTLRNLISAEVLVSAEESEIACLLDRNRQACSDLAEREFVLFPSSYCNMACEYCGQEHTPGRLGAEHRDAVFDRIRAAFAAPPTSQVVISWFGGEPMTGYPTILYIGTRALAEANRTGKRLRTSMVTNGTLLTEARIRRLYHETGLTYFNISLDGPRGVHDRRRPLKSGRNSFDRIVAVVGAASRAEDMPALTIQLRTNVDVDNAKHVYEYLTQLATSGVNAERVVIEFAMVSTWSPNRDMSSRVVEWNEFAEKECHWLDFAQRLGLKYRVLPRSGKPVVCEAGTRRAEVLSADGGVYSCVAMPLVPGRHTTARLAELSDLADDQLRPRGDYDDWLTTVAAGETPCRDCRIFGLCGGACPKEWREGQIPCPTYKSEANIQWRLDQAAARHGLLPA